MKYILLGLCAAVLAGAGYYFYDGNAQLFGSERERHAREFAEDVEYQEDDVFALEYDADSEDECDASDVFDGERGVCVYECVDEAECAQLADEAEEELEQWGDAYEDSQEPISEKPASEDDIAAMYRVGHGETITRESGSDTADYRAIWEQIAGWSPDTFTNTYIERFGVYDDAQNDTLAYVHDEDGNGAWDVVVNAGWYKNATDRERATTLVHELAHIVTLNTQQVKPGDEGTCPASSGFFTGEGCAKPGTYMHDFVKQFWSEGDLALVGGGAGEGDSGLYEKKSASFVTDYAATNPGEDIAESFAIYILDNKHASPQTVAEKKVSFFYAYPALVTFRSEMRTGLITGIVRARRAR